MYSLAEQRPITEVTVAELCRAAKTTRDTFYRHASSPTRLLSDMLGDEIRSTIRTRHPDAASGAAMVRRSERALLMHFAEHERVYRNAMTTSLVSELREIFETILRDGLLEHARLHPDILPADVSSPDDASVLIAAAYAASGTVGAIEQWLQQEPLDVDRGVRLIVASSPQFWLRESSIESI